jgi:YebC/PmpR family DNA-binding regulatory protein|tara:strand:- start:1236 stop:1991 length:756 start_codon:yes stop_codon:yes gene_type:complete
LKKEYLKNKSMAGHSHWAGIKHKKGRADKERSKIFSKLSREITVAAKLGDKDPDMNPRLRTAIQAAKQSNMPKENISRAISKSELDLNQNYQNLRYEGFGPFNVAFIIETLTDNKNRSASSIRTILQKNGGRLGETGSTSHLFFNCGVMHIQKDKFNEEDILEIAINAGAKDCLSLIDIHEIITEKEDFYKVKSEIEKKAGNFEYSSVEWRAINCINLNKEQNKKIVQILESLDEDDDVQNTFINCKIEIN